MKQLWFHWLKNFLHVGNSELFRGASDHSTLEDYTGIYLIFTLFVLKYNIDTERCTQILIIQFYEVMDIFDV